MKTSFWFLALMAGMIVLGFAGCDSSSLSTGDGDLTACESDEDCASGLQCQNGVCVAVDGDLENGDIPDGDVPVDGDWYTDGDPPIDGDNPIDGDVPNPRCIELGQQGSIGRDSCCEGLVEISIDEPEDPGDLQSECVSPPVAMFTCSRCGNGVCSGPENVCNCDQDCPRPADWCVNDADCGEASCADVTSRACIQYIPYCQRGQCDIFQTRSENSFCYDDACTPLECRPGDSAPYTCWDGTEVLGCVCETINHWVCTPMPEAACPDEPICGVGQATSYSCPDGQQVLECECVGGECAPECMSWYEDQQVPDDVWAGSWVDSCTGQILLDNVECLNCEAQCEQIGTAREGWFDSCSGALIKRGSCAPDWECVDNPAAQCEPDPTECETKGGVCVGPDGLCPDGMVATNNPFGCDANCCMPNNVSVCEGMGGECVQRGTPCPSATDPVDLSCGSDDLQCCRNTTPQCLDHGGECFEGYQCPDGWWSTSGVYYECHGENEGCCFPPIPEYCEEAGGICSGYMQPCPPGSIADDRYSCMDGGGDCCMPYAPPECIMEGGYCNANANCQPGYQAINNPMGCEYPSGVCCMESNPPECSYDSQCGYPNCETTADGGCVETVPDCANGTCISFEDRFRDRVCNVNRGRCIIETTYCVSASQCGDPTCIDTEDGLCLQRMPACRYGQCTQWPNGTVDGACDYQSGLCVPYGEQCTSDRECGAAKCFGDEPGFCFEEVPVCENGQCEIAIWDYPEAVCDPSTGRCEPYSQQCTSDRECGESYCYNEMSGCVQEGFYCNWQGMCESEMSYYENTVCDEASGQCTEQMLDCQQQHGYCNYLSNDCLDGFTPSDAVCDGMGTPICCAQAGTVTCQRLGGYCNMAFGGCDEGYFEFLDTAGCPSILGLQAECCVPGY